MQKFSCTIADSPDSPAGTGRFLVMYLAARLVSGGVSPRPSSRSPDLKSISLKIDKTILNPVLEPQVKGKISLIGIFADGQSKSLPLSGAKISWRTVAASGGVEVISLIGNQVRPVEGGLGQITATVDENGKIFSSSVEVEVRPFYRDYHQTLVLKLMMGMDGEPVERLANDPVLGKPNHQVICTFDQALKVIAATDRLTRGIPKIVYLVGWQKGGHDHLYPAWSEVNPRLKSNDDPTALDGLRRLIRSAKRYHTTVSLHINMVDAYQESPLWSEYKDKDLLARESDGSLLITGTEIKGMAMYNVVYPREWEAGFAQKRIDDLIQMVPELKEGHTIHIDAFIAQRAEYDRFKNADPISPWHALPAHGALTPERYVETQRKIFHYWRERGFDVTGEGIFWSHPPGEGFTGLQAMSWWYPNDPDYEMEIPESLMARGRTNRDGDGDFRFGSSMHGEEIFDADRDHLPGFLGMFCRTTLPWYFLSRLDRLSFKDGVLSYSKGFVAREENGKRSIKSADYMIREDDDLFVPALWHRKEIIAYSEKGYSDRVWRLPPDWRQIRSCDVYRIGLKGSEILTKGVKVVNSSLRLSLSAGEAISIIPSGAKLETL